jgi:hypothetical protein
MFGVFLYKALSSNLSYEQREQHLRSIDREQRRLWLFGANPPDPQSIAFDEVNSQDEIN